ncbi:MAG: hypothetical protein WCQ90_11335, partial [Deltaproteobacteria bacterium]
IKNDSAVAPVAATAPEDPVTGEFAASAMTQYIWRGYELSRNSAVIQPSIAIGYKGFTANIWGNIDTQPYYSGHQAGKSYSGTWNETDMTISYIKTLGLFNVGAGYIYYSLKALNQDAQTRADAQEFFGTVGLNTLLNPTLTVYYEVSHYRNMYALFSLTQTFELHKRVSLKLFGSGSYLYSTYADATLFAEGAGYGGYPKFDQDANVTDEKFNDFHEGVLTVSLPIKATEKITVTPLVTYLFPLSGAAGNEMKGQGLKGAALNKDKDNTFIVVGLTVSFAF